MSTGVTDSGSRKRTGPGYVFGLPLGDLGWFASLLMGTSAGFAAFFAGTFLGIVGLTIYGGAAHAAVDYSLSYRRVGLPLGLVVLVVSYAILGTLWVRRITRRA